LCAAVSSRREQHGTDRIFGACATVLDLALVAPNRPFIAVSIG
jgi:hypothetical protein